MSRRTRALAGVAALAALAACSNDIPTTPRAIPTPSSPNASMSATGAAHARVCPGAAVGSARCHALVLVDAAGAPLATTVPSGYGPSDLQSAYGLAAAAATNGATQTIAIVDAYNDPNAESDMNVYRSQYGLPACTTASGCFRKVSQTGTTTYPKNDGGWAQEISLDLDMASAICPKCHILLVEASSSSFANLSAAVDEAVKLGATVISNSYGGGEYAGEVADQAHYHHPGVAITVSSGDAGYGVEFPAASQYVIAVGGTSLRHTASGARAWTETVWSGAGSGCSAYVSKPSWQTDGGCARRTVSDVSAVADPNTGVAVYDSFAYRGRSGWMVFGGTSVASPIIASVYALAGNASTASSGQSLYGSGATLFDIISGSNGSCGGSYLCTGAAGYDGPTGKGTPNGIGAF
jgi:subtilase family serine protease